MQRRGVWSTYSHSCGGSVYNNNYIIDASHCVDGYIFKMEHFYQMPLTLFSF
jgi:hypothetical protein